MITEKEKNKLESLETRFQQAMDNDFNTAQALGHLFDAAKIVNKVIGGLGDRQHPADLELLANTGRTISELGAIAGILRENPKDFLTRQKKEILASIDIEPALIEQLIVQRNDARAAKDWAMSDQIRDQLLGHGIELKDGPVAGLLARSVIVLNREGQVAYTQQVDELSAEPDYEKALAALDATDQEPLDVCTSSFSAEDSRGDGTDEPCDDGRAG